MATPEYKFGEGCPKCDNSPMPKKFIPAEGTKTEYLDCSCDLCGFKCTMQTLEDVFKQMDISWKKGSGKK